MKKNYTQLSTEEKKQIITRLYVVENHSFADIASSYGTYANKIRRDAKSFGIKIRNKSEAQKNALITGKHKHPTKGQSRPESTKEKIGEGVMRSWEELSDTELQDRKQKAKENWDKLSNDQKVNMQRSATNAVRVASKVGSKLEKFLLNKLIKDGHSVDFHKEQTLVNTKLQIDLFLPKYNIAIEVDGPSHFAPVWGEDSLARNKSYDQKKEGLIIGRGWYLIRIKQTKDFSPAKGSYCYSLLDQTVQDIINNKITSKSLTIEV
jgi:very-short-patch-repair endonuclease